MVEITSTAGGIVGFTAADASACCSPNTERSGAASGIFRTGRILSG